jgi:hypothetical protein
MPHEEFHEAHQLRNEKDEREDAQSEQCVAKNFADNIAVQDAHGANAECSTGARPQQGRHTR